MPQGSLGGKGHGDSTQCSSGYHYLLLISCNYSNWMGRGGAGGGSGGCRYRPLAVPAWSCGHLLAATRCYPWVGSDPAGHPDPALAITSVPRGGEHHRDGQTPPCLHPASPQLLSLPSAASSATQLPRHVLYAQPCLQPSVLASSSAAPA